MGRGWGWERRRSREGDEAWWKERGREGKERKDEP